MLFCVFHSRAFYDWWGRGVIPPPPPPSPGADGLIRGCWVARDAQCSTVLFPVGISHLHVGNVG